MASDRAATPDVQIRVKRDAAANIVAEVELAKDGETGLQFVSRLKVVKVGVDPDRDPITSCVIEAVEGDVQIAKSNRPRLPKGAQIALRALQKAIDEVGAIPPAADNIPAKVKTVTVDQWRQYAYRIGISTSDEPRAKRQAFQRASETLLAGKEIAIWEPQVWLARRGEKR